MGLAEVKKELKKLEKDKLIDLIGDLYKKQKSVKEYLDFFVNQDEEKLLETYKDRVLFAFYPNRGRNYSIKDAKQALKEFEKLEPSPEYIADLRLYYVETGIDFCNDFGNMDDSFYNSLSSVYYNCISLIQSLDLIAMFEQRLLKLLDNTHKVGWGIGDYFDEEFSNHFPGIKYNYQTFDI